MLVLNELSICMCFEVAQVIIKIILYRAERSNNKLEHTHIVVHR